MKTPKYIDNLVDEARDQLEISAIRSGGKWWQNVNKRSTKIQIRDIFDYEPHVPEENWNQLVNPLIIESEKHRTQGKNREDALEKWERKIRALFVRKKHRVTTVKNKVKKKLARKRLESKKKQADKKRNRGKNWD